MEGRGVTVMALLTRRGSSVGAPCSEVCGATMAAPIRTSALPVVQQQAIIAATMPVGRTRPVQSAGHQVMEDWSGCSMPNGWRCALHMEGLGAP